MLIYFIKIVIMTKELVALKSSIDFVVRYFNSEMYWNISIYVRLMMGRNKILKKSRGFCKSLQSIISRMTFEFIQWRIWREKAIRKFSPSLEFLFLISSK